MTTAIIDDVSSKAFWEQPAEVRDEVFARLRATPGLPAFRAAENDLLPPGPDSPGYRAVTRHADVRAVSRAPRTFASGQGVMFFDAPQEFLESSQSFIAMDAPRHTHLRGLVSSAFTPRQVRRLEDRIAVLAREVVDELLEHGPGDFVEHCAKKLPLRLFSDMFGLPESERERVVVAADEIVSGGDDEVLAGRHPAEMLFGAITTIHEVALELAAERRARPTDDLLSALVHAEVDGERLTDPEISAFMVLLSVAGNDTTRHTTSHGLKAFTDHPDQRAPFLEDPETGVEELVRWASPVMTFRRTATQDAELAGERIAAGERVVLFYGSANRDEAAFTDPYRFDVRRQPNHHVGFGGGGPHYCLGASLARTQLRCLFVELLTRIPDIEAGAPDPLVGPFINGVKRLPCRW